MIIIFLPNVLLFLIYLYLLGFSIFFSFLSTIVTYITISIMLYKNNLYTIVNDTLNNMSIIITIENGIKLPIIFTINQLLKIEKIKKYYLQLKVRILLYVFNIVLSLIPKKKEHKLTEDLQNDYLEILKQNKFENKTK